MVHINCIKLGIQVKLDGQSIKMEVIKIKTLNILLFISMIILTGCSSTYTIADFPSEDKFYKDFNKSANNKTLLVKLDNDSSFTFEGSANISNDSLTIIKLVKKEINISRGDIKDIIYSGSDMTKLSAKIVLKNGTSAKAKNVSLLADSSINALVIGSSYENFHINRIKEISYKNYWIGVPIRMITCTIGGFIASVLTANIIGTNNYTEDEGFYVVWGITGIGLVTGLIWGGLDGYTYTYQFNP